jgi:subtilisin family serine protease
MGTMAGGDGSGPFAMDIGMAPDAEWIACVGCDLGNSCSDEALTSCAEWIVAPTDVYGNNPNPLMAPDVVNNSWGGGGEDDWYYSYAEAWNAANIIPVFSAGNAGPGCDTLGSPGSMNNVIGVGGTDSNDFNYASSSRGPGSGTGVFPVQKPNIAAPGESIPSSVPGNAYSFYSGTSMAAPHVAGMAALLRQVDPNVDMATILMVLEATAVTDLDIKNGTWCGAGPSFPNYVFGYGRIDALNAVAAMTALAEDLPWVSEDPTAGSIEPLPITVSYDGSMTVNVTFDSNPVEAGVYEGALRILHNDPFTGEVLVTLRLTVLPEPKLFLPFLVSGYPVILP